jgi:hypothetical protein
MLFSHSVTDLIYTGNAKIDGEERRGWILGHFMPVGDIRRRKDVEIRWAIHESGERREITSFSTVSVIHGKPRRTA